MRWLLAVGLAACSFEHAAGPGDASMMADATDAAIDMKMSGVTCYDKWLDGTIRFDTPALVANVNDSVAYDRDPFLPENELTIYFSTGRTGMSRVFMAKRANLTSSFGTPEEATPFSSTSNESKLSMAANELIAVVATDRPGTTGGLDVWESIRLTKTDQWPAMNRTNMGLVNTTFNDHDPMLSADGQRLYLAPDQPAPQHLVVATRGGDGRFGLPVALTMVSSSDADANADPAVTPDERILAFASNRSGNGDLYYSTRPASGIFGPALPIPDLNTAVPEGDPHVSSDGCRIYFARAATGYQYDLYVASAH